MRGASHTSSQASRTRAFNDRYRALRHLRGAKSEEHCPVGAGGFRGPLPSAPKDTAMTPMMMRFFAAAMALAAMSIQMKARADEGVPALHAAPTVHAGALH